MAKKIFIVILIFSISFLLFLPGCKKKTDELGVSQESATPAGDLFISYVSPKGKTEAPHETETIVVIFDQPMVPLEVLPEGSGSGPIKLEPSFRGKYRWLNPKTLTFTPDKRLPFSTEIKASIPAGTISHEGCTLKQDFTWSFQTIRPLLKHHFPRNNQRWLPLDTQILLVFNQPVDRDQAQDYLKLKDRTKEKPEASLDFSLSKPKKEFLEEHRIKFPPDHVLLLRPGQKLEKETTYFVEVQQGLPGREGPLGMEKGITFRFETFGEFRFDSLYVDEPHNPHNPLRFRLSNPVVYKEFVQEIRFEPEISIPDYYSEWDHHDSTLWLSLPLQPETFYRMQLSPELVDIFGNTLGEEIIREFTTDSYPESVSMKTGHVILEASSDLNYPVYVVNTQEVLFQATRIKKENILPLLSRKNLFMARDKFDRKNFFRFGESLKFDIKRNKKEVVPLNLKTYFPEDYGIIFIQLDTRLKDKWSRYPKALLQVTDMGISGKFSPENNLIWVSELKTGVPVAGADVELRDDSNKILWRGKTDEVGVVETPGWKALDMKAENRWRQPRQWVFVTKGEDMAFTSSEWETGISPYRFGIDFDWNPEPVKVQGYIYTDRGIYRAGETVHIKGILRKREKGEWSLLPVKNIECQVVDPFQKNVFKKKTDLDSFGSFAFDLETREEASLGYYRIKATIPPASKDQKSTVVSSSFRIEAFRPAEFEVHLRSLQESFVFGDTYEAQVRANYLFGGAMASQKVSWHLRLNPASFYPPGHKGYVFGNQIDRWERYGQEDSRLLSSGETALDEKGRFKVTTKLEPEKEKDTVVAALEATVQGPSRRSVSNRIQTIVHRGEYYIGLKPSTTFLNKGNDIIVDVICVKPNGSPDPQRKIRLSLLKREWHSVRRSEIGGRFRWISKKKDTEIDSRTMRIKEEAQKVNFSPEKSGFYLLKAEGKDSRGNTITTTTYFYVTGKDYVPWERRDDDTVELVADSSSYHPGDTAKILVKSPYERANALITIEREFVMESRIQKLTGSSEQIDIPIKSDHIPNVYVSVLLIQGRTSPKSDEDSEDLGRPSFKIGYAKLNVDPSEKRLTIDIQKLQDTYKPGEEVTLELRVKDFKGEAAKASLSLAVVDVGVLNLIGFRTPDPFSLFYSHKPLAVRTTDTRPFVVRQLTFGEKGEDVGGGAGERMKAALGSSLSEVELRGDFKFTAYWNPTIITDEFGRASVSFTLPDNLTTFRVMAVAQTKDSKFGRSETNFRVTKPLLLLASLPRFARLGDEFQGGVVIHNQSSSEGEVALECQAKGIQLLAEKSTRTFSLAPGEGKEFLFPFQVNSPGTAVVEFRARMGEESDGLTTSFPLRMPRPTETVALFENTTTSKEEKLRIPEDAYPSETRLELLTSATALSGLRGSIDYLTDYPYLCLEQRLSSILPYLVAKDVLVDFKLSSLTLKEMQEYVQKTLTEIYDYQKDNGGFGLWPDSRHVSPYISCYAAFALAKALQSDYKIDQQRTGRLIRYLQNMVRGKLNRQNFPYSQKTWKTIHAFAMYALSLHNQPEPSYAEKLFMERDSLSLFAKTLLLKALNKGKGSQQSQNTLVQELINKAKVSPTTAHFEDDEGRKGRWIYSSNNRTTAFILQSLLDVGSNNPLIPSVARWLVERRKAGVWTSTQENFYVFYALNDFYKKYENIDPDFKIQIFLAGKLLLEETFNTVNRTERAEISLQDKKPGKIVPLKIKKKGQGTLYYQARLSYAPKRALKPRDEGFILRKDITNLDGQPMDSVQAGSLVVVTLQVVLPRESLFVVLNDPLPAGLEAVNPTFLTESEEQQRRLREMEGAQQRWRWWQGFNHIEMLDDRVLLFADSLLPGVHTHRYLARALTPGTFHAPGAKIEEMYSPEVFGRSSEIKIKVIR